MTSHRNLQTLQAGRGLAAVAVVFFHANLTLALPKYLGQETLHVFYSGYSGIYYFFVLSGTVMMLAHWDQIGRHASPWNFFRKRFNRVYLPLWVVLLGLIPFLFNHLSPSDVALAFSAVPSSTEPILAVEWTLRHEVLFYALFGLLLWRARLGSILLAIWFLGSLAAPFLAFPYGFVLSPLHLLFGMGIGAAVAIKRWDAPWPLPLLGVGILIATILSNAYGPSFNDGIWASCYGLGSLLSIVGFARLEHTHGLTVPAPLRKLGDASYSLYLVHFPVVSACAKVMTVIDKKIGPLPVTSYFLATVAICIGAGLVFFMAIERPIMRWVASPRVHGAPGP